MTTTTIVLGQRRWQVFRRPAESALVISPARVARMAETPLPGDEPSNDTVVLEFKTPEALDYVIDQLTAMRDAQPAAVPTPVENLEPELFDSP